MFAYDRVGMMFDLDDSSDAVVDRLAALRAMPSEERERVLLAQPEAAAALVGVGMLTGALHSVPAKGRHSLTQVAELLGHPATVQMAIRGLSGDAYRMLAVACWRRGAITAEQMRHEAPQLDDVALASRRAELVDRMLVDPTLGYLVPRPGVSELVGLPGRSMTELSAGSVLTSDMLLVRLRALGVAKPPTRRQERLDLLVELLSDRRTIDGVVASLTAGARALLDRMTPDEQLLESYGANAHFLDQMRYGALNQRYGAVVDRMSPATKAMHELLTFGLVGVGFDRSCFVWLEVWAARHGRVFAQWQPPTDARMLSIAAGPVELPAVVGRLQTLMTQIQAEPIAGLKVGGIGVKVTRDLAKRLGQPPRLTALLTAMTRRLHLVSERTELVGKGRNASWQYTYVASPEFPSWGERPAVERWSLVVENWMVAADVADPTHGRPASARRQVLADLLALPAGIGVHQDDAAAWFATRRIIGQHVDVDELLLDVRLVGLAPETGPLGLTDLARAMLADPAAAARLLPAAVKEFVVQPDHSVVAPPNLDGDVRARLERIATATGSGGALVFRLDTARIGQDIAAGESADAICAFLEEHATVPVAPAVLQFVHDAERRRGGLTVAAAATILTADDTLGLADAIKVKAARLTLIAPTVAVSDLPPAKVLAALRAKGLAPRADASAMPTAARAAAAARAAGSSGPITGVLAHGPAPAAAKHRPPLKAPTVLHPDADRLRGRIAPK